MSLKTKKTQSGWAITFDPKERWQGATVEQKHLYKRDTLAKLGIDYSEDPDAAANEYGTSNAMIVWERAVPDKILRKGHVVE